MCSSIKEVNLKRSTGNKQPTGKKNPQQGTCPGQLLSAEEGPEKVKKRGRPKGARNKKK
jgi:hypothetical protein